MNMITLTNKLLGVFVLLILAMNSVAAVGYVTYDNPTLPNIVYEAPEIAYMNYSTVNVNNSDYWDGLDTPADITYDELSAGDVNALGYSGVFTFLEGFVGQLDMSGDPWHLGATDLEIGQNLTVDGSAYVIGNISSAGDTHRLDTASGNQTLILDSELNQYSCIELREGGSFGFSICNDGAGSNRFVIANADTGAEWFWIDRDDGTINFLNDTVFHTTVNIENLNVTDNVTTDGYFIGDGSLLTGIPGVNASWNQTYADAVYVPYTDATDNVNVTGYNISASWFFGLFDIEIDPASVSWLQFNGSTLTFNETKLNASIDAVLETEYFNASSVGRVVGTDTGGDLGDIQTYNMVAYNISEVGSSYDLRVNFTNITEFTTLIFRHKSEEIGNHVSAIQIWDYSDSAWEGYGLLTESETYVIKTLGVYDDDEHIGAGADLGIVQVRVYIPASSPPKTHKHEFDWVALSKGYGTPVGQEIDPVSFHQNTNLNNSGYNISADIIKTNKVEFSLGQWISNVISGWIHIEGNLNVTGNIQINGGNITSTNETFGMYNDGDCIVIGDLSYTSLC